MQFDIFENLHLQWWPAYNRLTEQSIRLLNKHTNEFIILQLLDLFLPINLLLLQKIWRLQANTRSTYIILARVNVDFQYRCAAQKLIFFYL